jgi:hypothetical protein
VGCKKPVKEEEEEVDMRDGSTFICNITSTDYCEDAGLLG